MLTRSLCALALLVPVAALAAPSVTLTANPTAVYIGDSTTLDWISTDVTACTASGAWAGAKATSGSEVITVNADSTYTLTCTTASGDVVVTWTNPTQNTDNSPLTDLVRVDVYAGADAGSLALAVAVPTTIPGATRSTTLVGEPAETRVYAAKAVNSRGAESALSATATRNVSGASISDSASVTAADPPVPQPPVLVAIEQVAYEYKVRGNGEAMLGRAIGTVPLGTECGTEYTLPGGYYQVSLLAVSVDKPRLSTDIILARCAWM